MDDFECLSRVIRSRRSVFPNVYTGEKIPDEVIWEMLSNANWAPNHRKTEPWRFQVFTGNALQDLSDYLAGYYKQHTPEVDFSEIKYNKTRKKPLQSSHVIAICMQRDPEERLPEWEEIAAVSCAVMNMWLSCTALGLGCYWSTPKSMAEAREFLQLKKGERCLGLLYIGVPKEGIALSSKRGAIEAKLHWRS